MLHSFVTAKLLPNLPSWVTYGLRAAERLVTTPFLALHVHNPSGPFVYGRLPNLFVITREKPSSPTAEYFALNHTESGVRSLTVHPPLPFNGPLYLLITPRLAGQFPEADNDPSKLFSESEPHQFEEHSLSLFSEALNSAKPSILDERNTGGDDEPGEHWDTWSAKTPRELPGVLVLDRRVPFDFQLLPLDVLPPEFETHLFEEIPLVRQLVLDYTWESCDSLLQYIETLRNALPKLISTGRLFRTPSLPTLQPLAIDALRPCTASLLSLPVIHDGDPNPIKGPQDDIADDWRDDIDAPDVELAVAEIVHAVPLGNIKVFVIDPTCLVDVDSPLKHALVAAFPPSEYAFNPKELLSLYVEYEGIRSADPNSHSSSMDIMLDVAQYLGAKVEGSHIKQAFKKTYTSPDLYEDAQKAVDLLSQRGYLCSLLPRFNLTLAEPIQSIRGLSTQFAVNNKEATFSWDSLFSFLQHSDPTLSRDQVLIVTPDLYCTAEAASRAGFPTAFVKRDDSRSQSLLLQTTASSITTTSLDDLARLFMDPASIPSPTEPEDDSMYPPFRIRDTWQCETMIGRGSFAWVWNAFDIHSGAGTAIKWELIHPTDPETIPYESAVYAQVHGCRGVVHTHWSGREINTNVLVIDRLGLNLEVLRRFCRGSFSLKTVLMLGEQMLATIDQVHSRGIIVRDIKPENFALGQVKDYKQLFLFDLGLSKLFLDPTTGKHMPFREGRGGIGTPRYASHNVYFGLEPSRRDDVEAVGVLLLYLLHGKLPSQGICAPDIPAKLRRIGEMKWGQPFSKLLQNSPTFFQKFFEHCQSLEFEGRPNYNYLRQLLRDAMAENNWEYDWNYDWWNPTEQGTLMPEEYKLDMSFVKPVRHMQNVL